MMTATFIKTGYAVDATKHKRLCQEAAKTQKMQ